MTVGRSPLNTLDAAAVLIVTGVAIALGQTILGGMSIIAIGVPVAVAAVWYLIRRPPMMLIAMIVVEVTNLAGVIAQHRPLPLFQLSLISGLLTVCIALRDPRTRARLNRGTLLCLGLFGCYLVTQFLAALGSQDIAVSMATLKTYVLDGLFLAVILLLTQITGRWWAVAAAFVVPLAVISLLCLVNQVIFAGTASFLGFARATDASGELITTLRYGGPGLDSNFWGRNLILGLPLAGALVVRAVRSGRRWVALGWAAALAALLAGVYLTQSRGTIISAAVVLFVWVLASGPAAWRKGAMGLPVVGLLLLTPGIGNRLTALVADVSGPQYAVDPSVLGRMAAQQSAWAMFRDRPLFGFGPNGFSSELSHYAGRVPTAVLHPPDAAHNLYAQFAADSGIVGLVGWTFFIGGFIWLIAIRVAKLSYDSANSERSLSAAVLAAIVGWSVASIFLHMSSFRTFAIVLALAGALASASSPDIGSVIQEKRATIRDAVVGLLAGMAVAAAIFAASGTETHTASQTITIMPTQQDDWAYAYALDMKSREILLPTYASLMAGNGSGFTAVADPVRGVITITVTDSDTDSARADLDVALSAATSRLADLGADSWYTITAVGTPDIHSGTTHSTASTAFAVFVGALVASGLTLAMRRRSKRQLPRHGRTLSRGGMQDEATSPVLADASAEGGRTSVSSAGALDFRTPVLSSPAHRGINGFADY